MCARLAMANLGLLINLKFPFFTAYEDTKGDAKCIKFGGMG